MWTVHWMFWLTDWINEWMNEHNIHNLVSVCVCVWGSFIITWIHSGKIFHIDTTRAYTHPTQPTGTAKEHTIFFFYFIMIKNIRHTQVEIHTTWNRKRIHTHTHICIQAWTRAFAQTHHAVIMYEYG